MVATPQALQDPISSPEIKAPKSCLTCYHFQVCAIFRAIDGLMTSSYPDQKESPSPFDAETLANICKEYASITIVANFLRGAETP